MSENILTELARLQAENARLKAVLRQHDPDWESAPLYALPDTVQETPPVAPKTSVSYLSPVNEKIALFRRLFRGRADVYPRRWESKNGNAGYSPVCDNTWLPDICGKPKRECNSCKHRQLRPLTDKAIDSHLRGEETLGVYPLLQYDTCYFLAIDFDGEQWRDDARSVMQSCLQYDVPASLEISRSGNGAHIWIFFSEPVPARQARMLGTALISHTCATTRQLSLRSYDRFFPSQDTLPKGGFGNLIALPLQKIPRSRGNSLFVDMNFVPFADQWSYLDSVVLMTPDALHRAILQASSGRHPLDVAFTADEDTDTPPWEKKNKAPGPIAGPLPSTLTLVLADQIFIDKNEITQSLQNRLVRLATFANPEFRKKQAMRLSVWNEPRLICCADNFPQHIGLPRGCLGSLVDMLESNGIVPVIDDRRTEGASLSIAFTGELRQDQHEAVDALLAQDIGVLHAVTAFGKTVAAIALIAQRSVSTLVVVHRTELLRQWQERMVQFLDIQPGDIGIIGDGKHKPGGKIDIGLIQTLSLKQNLTELLDVYGQIIVDECHHVSAVSFEHVIKHARARYVVGLTATPQRQDGRHPIIFMQCGAIVHSVAKAEHAPVILQTWVRHIPAPAVQQEFTIQDVFRTLCENDSRNLRIAEDVLQAWNEGRKILLLTERITHLEKLRELLAIKGVPCLVLHGRLSRKQRMLVLEELKTMPDADARVILATGRLIGEGFDHSPLDTMVLAMPVSWKGTLQQYAGRLHREHADKADIRIYDYVETDNAQLNRMWKKRRAGYMAMGYQVFEINNDMLPGIFS